ncbi:nuclear matrix constituent protein 1-like [Nicotiana tomentosiformis]|uniref:nuclear matrix constituent protein 1-like n=1 Tax=Nicotiana tomentosiformis TaxID=4098 RepID=UPI00388C6570
MMHDFIMAEDSELWNVICDGSFVPMKIIREPEVSVPKTRKEYNDADRKVIEKTSEPKRSSSVESKVNAIIEAKNLQKLTIDELIGNLKTYEIKKKKDNERREPKRERNLVLKTDSNDSSGEDGDMAYLTRRFQKMVRMNGGIPKRGSSSKPKHYDLYHKCGKPGHFIKDCPLLKKYQYKNNFDKEAKRNPVPDKRLNRKNVADNVVKQALATWGDSSSESEEDNDHGDSSMMAVESEATEYDSIFALMAQSDDDEDDDDDDEVNFLDVQGNLKSYSSKKKLMSLANVLIDAYHREAEQSRDDLVVVVVDLKETIECAKKEKEVSIENTANLELERDDLVVVVVDLKETIESVEKEKDVLTKRVANSELERDDLLAVVVDLNDTIKELKGEGRHETLHKGKEVANEPHLRLEDEMKTVKSRLCIELEKKKQLQEELGRVKSDLEKSLKWTWSSDAITAIYINNGGNKQGIGFQREKTPYNPHSKCVTIPDNWLCIHCGNNGHLKENCKFRVQSQQKNKVFAKKVTIVKEPALQGGSVSFGNGKKRYILGLERIGKSPSHSIENVYYVNGLKYSLLSVSQICDMGNKSDNLRCLSAVEDDAELWHIRPSHASFTLLVNKDLDSHDKTDQEEEQSTVPGEVIDMANGNTDMMIQVKDSDDNGTSESPADIEEPGSSIITTEAENRVADADQVTTRAERESHSEIPGPSHNKIKGKKRA